MPRRPRLAAGDLAYHVLNRRVEVTDEGQVLPSSSRCHATRPVSQRVHLDFSTLP